jgi:hypothetical protein
MDHDVASGERGQIIVLGTESVSRDVAGDDHDPARDLSIEIVGQLLTQTAESVVRKDLPARPVGRTGAASRAYQKDKLAAGYAPQQALDESSSEETGAPGDRDAFAVKCVLNHGSLSSIIADAPIT